MKENYFKILFLLFSITGFSQSLDPTFDGDGIVKSELSNGLSSANTVYDGVIQPDGKVIYVGSLNTPTFQGSFIVRYNTDGTKDTTFNIVGFKTINSSQGFQTVSLQADGKIIASTGSYSVYRFLPDGTIDTSFNSSGRITFLINGFPMLIKSVAIQSDNKIVCCGYVYNGTNNDFGVIRLNANGTYDTSFDSDGIKLIPIGTSQDAAYSVKIQTDGKIVMAGESANGTNSAFALVLLNVDGSLDNTFGVGGITTTVVGTTADYGRALEILSDGKIVLLGASSGTFAIARYTTSGILDATFGTAGKRILTQSLTISPTSTPRLKVLSSGEMLLLGTSVSDFMVVKLLASGAYDSSFDTDGVVTINNDVESSSFLLPESNGNILVGGTSYVTSTTNYRLRQIELTGSGNIISNVIKDMYLGVNSHDVIKVLLDGKFLVLGGTPNASLIKYNQDGSIDTAFGNSGVVNLIAETIYTPNPIHIYSNNKILLGFNQYLMRLNPDGTFDNSFGIGGIVNLNTLTNQNIDHPDSFLVLPNNQIVVSSEYKPYTATIQMFSVTKLNNDGTVDVSFANNGYFFQKINPDTNAANEVKEFARHIYLQSDNKLVFIGYSRLTDWSISQNKSDIFSLRMDPNGVVDATYGNSGIKYIVLPSSTYPQSVSLSGDNKLLISSSQTMTNGTVILNSIIIKLDETGQFDNTFGVNGISNDISGGQYSVMTVQSDGKILKAGVKNNHFAISRYNADGSVDTAFGLNGELNTVIGVNSSINCILLQSDNKIVVGGNSFDGTSDLITLARFTNTNLGVVDFNNQKNSLLIYPNPIETSATLNFTLKESQVISIELFDLQGKLVQTITKDKMYTSGNQKSPINLNQNFKTGSYILKMSSATGNQSIQIIKK
ncbi:MAG: T9SS type A sorting domain-containing protein [Flavobacterium sp.]